MQDVVIKQLSSTAYMDHEGLGFFLAPKYQPKTIYFVTSRQDWLGISNPKMSADLP